MSFDLLHIAEPGARRGVELVVIGNLLVDDIVYPDGRTRMGEAGGAALYLALAARLWGTRVGVSSLQGDDYPVAALAALAERGVDLAGVRALGRNGVRTWLLYEERVRRVIHRLGGPTHEAVSPAPGDLPAAYLGARAFHLAPMPIARQRELIEFLSPRRDAALSVDPHEPVTEASLPAWRELLAHVDVFWPSDDELRLDHADDDPRGTLRRLAGGRLRLIAWKRGREGGLLYDAKSDVFIEWPPVPRLTGDPTGAGDAFAGGFLAGLLAGADLEGALDRAMVATSFALEDFGARGLLAATPELAERRLDEWFDAETRA